MIYQTDLSLRWGKVNPQNYNLIEVLSRRDRKRQQHQGGGFILGINKLFQYCKVCPERAKCM